MIFEANDFAPFSSLTPQEREELKKITHVRSRDINQHDATMGLSPKEIELLGKYPKNKKQQYVPKDKWGSVRDWMARRAQVSNPKLDDPSMIAVTPGETVQLLNHPKVQDWHKKMSTFKVPPQYDTIAFVPCAKDKDWLKTKGSNKALYPSYNRIKDDPEHSNTYFVTISEPLGVVPMEFWGNFPQYDNPGLFRDPPQQSSAMNKHFEKDFGVPRYHMPFDDDAYDSAIDSLSGVISAFVKNNKTKGRKIISFVKNQENQSMGTHTDMLNRLEPEAQLNPEHRFKKRAKSGVEPEGLIRDTLNNLK
jgi:hypothetical protein